MREYRDYNEFMLHNHPAKVMYGRNLEKPRGRNMLGRVYQIISEMASRTNRKYAQRPHKGNVIIDKFRGLSGMIVAQSRTLTAPSACSRKPLRKVMDKMGDLRKLLVNGKEMRMLSVLKGGKYRKILKDE